MRVNPQSVFSTIFGLAILVSIAAVPAFASGGSDPAASVPDNPIGSEDVVQPNTEATDQGSTPKNSIGSAEGVGQQSPNTKATDQVSTPQ